MNKGNGNNKPILMKKNLKKKVKIKLETMENNRNMKCLFQIRDWSWDLDF